MLFLGKIFLSFTTAASLEANKNQGMKTSLGSNKNKEPSNNFGTLQVTCKISDLVLVTDTKASEVNVLGENKDKED